MEKSSRMRNSKAILSILFLFFFFTASAEEIKIQDPENHLSKKEKQIFERAVNYATAFYNRIFLDRKVDFSDINFTIIPDHIAFVLYLNNLGIAAPLNSPGIYVSSAHELVVCTDKKFKGSFINIACHELSHAFLHIHSGNKVIPAWLNEGLASYLQEMTYDKKIITQRVNRRSVARVKTLIELKDLNLPDFVTWNYQKFSAESFTQEGYGYAVGYCMVLFLMQQDENNAITIFKKLVGEQTAKEIFDNCYTGGFEQFEEDFKKYYSK